MARLTTIRAAATAFAACALAAVPLGLAAPATAQTVALARPGTAAVPAAPGRGQRCGTMGWAVVAASGAKPPPVVGNFRVSAPGIPRTAWIRGRALKFTIDVSQTSRYHVAVSMALSMWAWTNPGFQQTRGITVSWRNPVTGRWVRPYSIDRNGTWYLGPEDTSLVLARDRVASIPVKIWFGARARPGTYNLNPQVAWWEVFNAAGNSIPAILGESPPNGYTYLIRVRG